MYHAVNTVFVGSSITSWEGKGEPADTAELETEMENNINDIKRTAKMTLTVFTTIVHIESKTRNKYSFMANVYHFE